MARTIRQHLRCGLYHVMFRGNNKQAIFLDEADRNIFYDILESATKHYDCKIHLFCLMTNHVHLLIEVIDMPLYKVSQIICGRYATKFNRKHNTVGHLFQGRYKAQVVQSDKYLLELCHYIHMNPIEASMVEKLDDYPWSSHPTYKGMKPIHWLTTDHVNDLLAGQGGYSHYMEQKISEADASPRSANESISEDSLFVKDATHKMLKHHLTSINLKHVPLKKLIRLICEEVNIKEHTVSSGSLSTDAVVVRSFVGYFAHYCADYKINQIAPHLGITANSLSKNISSQLKQGKLSKKHQQIFEKLKRTLSTSHVD